VAKRKLQQFTELETFTNVIQNPQLGKTAKDISLKGQWNNIYFKNKQPIILELGCGKGEYTVGLAVNYLQNNYIGVDIKGNRLWTGAKIALEKKLTNVAFVRTRIENLETIFAPQEIDEIWITFPDPQPTEKREKKRLTSPRYLSIYQRLLKPGGLIHLKTDNQSFAEYTLTTAQKYELEILSHTFDLYDNAGDNYQAKHPELKLIQTYYEKKFSAKGFKINYCCLKMPLNPINWVKHSKVDLENI